MDVSVSSGRAPWAGTRYLTDDEETKLLAGLSQEDRDFYVTLPDSGARWGGIAKLPWSQVDIDNRVILLYRFKMKNESVLPTDLYRFFALEATLLVTAELPT